MDKSCIIEEINRWLPLVDLVVTTGVGVWIGTSVQGNFTRKRFLKEYFISELGNIKSDYKLVFDQIYSSSISAVDLKSRLKVISLRVNSFEKYCNAILKIDKLQLSRSHSDFQKYITGEDEFNNQFKNEKLVFSSSIITEITKLHQVIISDLTNGVVKINSAKLNSNRKARKLIKL